MDIGYLFVSDFDGTIADTFEKNPKGVGVQEAYRLAIKEIFGQEGLNIYDNIGGLQNRAPEELVSSILKNSHEENELFKSAEACFDNKSKTLKRLVPKNKEAPLEWIPKHRDRLFKTITEMLVLIKMSFLMDEIGTVFPNGSIWPRECDGFSGFYRMIDNLREDLKMKIQFAIVSSGHEKFIIETFIAWGLRAPTIFVTDDDMRNREYPPEIKRRVKPSSFLFDLVHHRWLESYGTIRNGVEYINLLMNTRKKMMFFGDDLDKDGELAKNADVPFGLFDPDRRVVGKKDNATSFSFASWSDLTIFFTQRKVKDLFIARKPFAEIISVK